MLYSNQLIDNLPEGTQGNRSLAIRVKGEETMENKILNAFKELATILPQYTDNPNYDLKQLGYIQETMFNQQQEISQLKENLQLCAKRYEAGIKMLNKEITDLKEQRHRKNMMITSLKKEVKG